jgi:hypothetical protein
MYQGADHHRLDLTAVVDATPKDTSGAAVWRPLDHWRASMDQVAKVIGQRHPTLSRVRTRAVWELTPVLT